MRIRKRVVALVIFFTVTVIAGLHYKKIEEQSKKIEEITLKTEQNLNKSQDEVKIEIYIPNKELTKLETKEIIVKYTENKDEIVRIVIENISKNLIERGIIKSDIVVINKFLTGKDMYVNLQYINEFSGDSKKIIYILYSISNSLIELGRVERVKFLVNNGEQAGLFQEYYQKNTDL